MSTWPAGKAKRVLAALQSGSHRLLTKTGWPDYVFAFHDQEEIGPQNVGKAGEANRIAA